MNDLIDDFTRSRLAKELREAEALAPIYPGAGKQQILLREGDAIKIAKILEQGQ